MDFNLGGLQVTDFFSQFSYFDTSVSRCTLWMLVFKAGLQTVAIEMGVGYWSDISGDNQELCLANFTSLIT